MATTAHAIAARSLAFLPVAAGMAQIAG